MPNIPGGDSSLFEDFLGRHHLRGNASGAAVRDAVLMALETHGAVLQAYGRLSEEDLQRHAASGIILHLLGRALAHLEAALVAFATESGLSSEVLSRAVVELTSSIEFILGGQPESRLLAFLDNFLANERKRLFQWEQLTGQVLGAVHEFHLQSIERRREGVDAMESVVAKLREEFRAAGKPIVAERWPNIATRFESTDDALGYRTYYARMSGQVHSDAEETIREMIARITAEPSLVERMADETVLFSRLMLYLALQAFLRASSTYVRHYQLPDALPIVESKLRCVEHELLAIAGELERINV